MKGTCCRVAIQLVSTSPYWLMCTLLGSTSLGTGSVKVGVLQGGPAWQKVHRKSLPSSIRPAMMALFLRVSSLHPAARCGGCVERAGVAQTANSPTSGRLVWQTG